MNHGLQQLFDNLSKSGGLLRRNEPLCRWISWRVGGPADLFYQPENRTQVIRAIEQAIDFGLPWTVLGAGSNLLVLDGGIRGLVIQTRQLQDLQLKEDGRLLAECGVWLPQLVKSSIASGWAGLESLAGIPGTLGGALVTNAGAHDQCIGDRLVRVDLINAGRFQSWTREQVGCVYRGSNIGRNQLVLQAEFQLVAADPTVLQGRVDDLLAHRRAVQNVGGANAGSVFKNPPGAAAWKLIDTAGMRGSSIGAAQVSERHANFIINRGGATAAEILELIGMVQERVLTCCGVELETEIRVVGEHEPTAPTAE